MKMLFLRQSMVFIFTAVVFGACGLPSYLLLEAPTVLDNRLNTVVAFKTPTNDNGINGYRVYYKIYTGLGDYEGEGNIDKEYFNPASSQYITESMPLGNAVLDKRGFLLVGIQDSRSFGSYTIEHPGPNTTVYMDFDPTEADTSKDRKNPIVGTSYPITTPLVTLARGVVGERNDGKFLSFVNDWAFGMTDELNDSDLRRGYSLQRYQPGSGSNFDSIMGGSTALTKMSPNPLQKNDNIRIGIAVHSVGIEIGEGAFEPTYSEPVYLGYVEYTTITSTPF